MIKSIQTKSINKAKRPAIEVNLQSCGPTFSVHFIFLCLFHKKWVVFMHKKVLEKLSVNTLDNYNRLIYAAAYYYKLSDEEKSLLRYQANN